MYNVQFILANGICNSTLHSVQRRLQLSCDLSYLLKGVPFDYQTEKNATAFQHK